VRGVDLDPLSIRDSYSAFLRPGRILLTGHSHQAWPDVAEDAQRQVFRDAAAFVDDKWGRAVDAKIERVTAGISARLGYAAPQGLAFGRSTHELVFRLLTCWPIDASTRVVTTTGEFHSLDRQLRRLQEAGMGVTWVDARERETLASRLIEAIVPGTSVVAFSAVLFEDSFVVPQLAAIARRAEEVGAALLLDVYHGFNVVPLPLAELPGEVYVTGGGYKYAQFGEGVCFLRVPDETTRTPLYTGWFADFDDLAQPRGEGARKVGFGRGASRFAGATYDPSAFYRAAAVLDHFDARGMSVARLRAASLRQTSRLIERLEREDLPSAGLELASPRRPELRGGFVALRCRFASALSAALREVGVFTDARGEILRLGPAPYLLDEELDEGVRLVVATARRGGWE
jgi:selenocysteine lyase/cysteine desulfurase